MTWEPSEALLEICNHAADSRPIGETSTEAILRAAVDAGALVPRAQLKPVATTLYELEGDE